MILKELITNSGKQLSKIADSIGFTREALISLLESPRFFKEKEILKLSRILEVDVDILEEIINRSEEMEVA